MGRRRGGGGIENGMPPGPTPDIGIGKLSGGGGSLIPDGGSPGGIIGRLIPTVGIGGGLKGIPIGGGCDRLGGGSKVMGGMPK